MKFLNCRIYIPESLKRNNCREKQLNLLERYAYNLNKNIDNEYLLYSYFLSCRHSIKYIKALKRLLFEY